MEELPGEKTLVELVEMGKSFEEQARKLYEMAEAFAQKYEKRLHEVRLAETQKQEIHSHYSDCLAKARLSGSSDPPKDCGMR